MLAENELIKNKNPLLTIEKLFLVFHAKMSNVCWFPGFAVVLTCYSSSLLTVNEESVFNYCWDFPTSYRVND